MTDPCHIAISLWPCRYCVRADKGYYLPQSWSCSYSLLPSCCGYKQLGRESLQGLGIYVEWKLQENIENIKID